MRNESDKTDCETEIMGSILNWLKQIWHPSCPQSAAHSSRSDQRGFDRYAVSFPVIISGKDVKGGENHEKTVLHDISGSGAMFMSQTPEKYYPGQLLKVSIMLDGTNDVRARIRTEATVIRIHHNGTLVAENRPDSASTGIAVQFDRSFEFERIDNSDYRSNG